MIRILSNDWHTTIASVASATHNDLLICSPFVAEEGIGVVRENITPAFRRNGRLTFVTNLSVAHVCDLATDPRAIRTLSESVGDASVYHLPGLHAKAYIADCDVAVVTSANLTAGGLYRNLECGVEIRDQSLVRQVRRAIIAFAELGALVPRDRLEVYCNALDGLVDAVRAAQRSAHSAFRQQFRAAIRPIEDDLLRMRLAGGAVHSVFARTIEYLLRERGPLSTVELHTFIQSIHPDLCDDAVDRVIDGKRFGKKWKHAVRTAQQQLKRQGNVELEGSKWRLTHG